MNEYYTTTTDSYLYNWGTTWIIRLVLIYATNDYTLIHVDEPNVIGINERMVNDG